LRVLGAHHQPQYGLVILVAVILDKWMGKNFGEHE